MIVCLLCLVRLEKRYWRSAGNTLNYPQRSFRRGTAPDLSERGSAVFRPFHAKHVVGGRSNLAWLYGFSVLLITI